MTLTSRLLGLTLVGAEWVLWLLVILSVVSVAIMLERGWFFWLHRLDVDSFGADLRRLLSTGKLAEARERAMRVRGVEAAVVLSGLEEATHGAEAAEQAMLGRKALEKRRLERYLAVLGTLGSNAPFLGLFGTVLGIIKAFHDLAANQAGGAGVVMAGISEALVATAVGLLVAIPAVVAFNGFGRRVRSTLANIDALAHLVLGQLKGAGANVAASKGAA